MAYKVSFSNKAIKQVAKIDEPFYAKIRIQIAKLAENPRPNGCKKLKGIDAYRIRVGVYRIIYTIKDNELFVEVISVGHRKDVYW